MRVLLSCLQGLKNHNIPGYKFWREYFANGIREAGHEVLEVPGVDWAEALIDADEARLAQWRTRTWEAVTSFVRRETSERPIHLFLSYLYPEQIDSSAITQLKRLGVPCVNFFCDNVRMFRRVPKEFNCFDLHWVPEYEALRMYEGAETPYIHAPMPCWVPKRLRTVPESETTQAAFLGSGDVLRQRLFSEAVRCGAEILLYGNGWDSPREGKSKNITFESLPEKAFNQILFVRKYGLKEFAHKLVQRYQTHSEQPSLGGIANGPVTDEDYFEITRNAIVAIGVNRVPSFRASIHNPLRYSRLRDIEAPMLGACYLTEWTEGVSQLYEPAHEIETYRNGEEMAAKLEELRRDPPRRRRMRQAAQLRALSEHTIAATLKKIATSLV